jgi:hypothetical protein
VSVVRAVTLDKVLTSSFRNDPNRPPELKVVTEVCMVIDVLGGDFKWASFLPPHPTLSLIATMLSSCPSPC